ncbi:penicillin-binding transpeptidase domain-containing protein [Sphaerisporangium corydalis]|uniref:Penicillin-binding transpeptidase domain-containing protein n=1 Tax=Sphaerisporangium corydalis TaxID=1441875 RepID=A0ABV9EBL5_9ACTN|nr:penicillin-binding transpeptidase domain-containing protein [Sphaerisporangium corydalis]
MRRRGLLALVVVSLVIVAAALVALVMDSRRVEGGPEQTGRAYLAAWASDDLARMRELVASPPGDFLEQHRRLTTDLQVLSVKLTPGTVVRRSTQTADLPFEGARQIGELGQWKFTAVLHLAVRDGGWKVIWTPETLHPGVAAGERLRIAEIKVPGTELLTRQGKPLPHDSAADTYMKDLVRKIDEFYEDPPMGWAVEAVPATGKARRLVVFREATERKYRITLDWWTQAAAARALDGVAEPAAIVAVRPSTGEVLAVADRLPGQGAFYKPYPPGSTFKIITAAALLGGPLTADSQVDCPAHYTVPQGRTFDNYQDQGHGTVTLRQAFALSCNTTFSRLAVERLGDGVLRDEAAEFGFGGNLKSGLGGVCGSIRKAGNGDELGSDAIGQNSVEATPLCMALVAAAVENGTWRPPRLMSEQAVKRLEARSRPKPKKLPAGVVAQLRSMMGAVVADGTAASAGLPKGVSGKTGTAQPASGEDHAWFVGYRGDLAFSVLVEHGGTGATAAASIAARFLDAL